MSSISIEKEDMKKDGKTDEKEDVIVQQEVIKEDNSSVEQFRNDLQ